MLSAAAWGSAGAATGAAAGAAAGGAAEAAAGVAGLVAASCACAHHAPPRNIVTRQTARVTARGFMISPFIMRDCGISGPGRSRARAPAGPLWEESMEHNPYAAPRSPVDD